MPKVVKPLTDTELKNTKPKEKDYILADGSGLQILIKADGSKLWQLRYTINGKRCLAGLGIYPKVTLQAARQKRDEYLKQVDSGINPIQAKRETKQAQVMDEKGQFYLVAYEWLNTLTNNKSTTRPLS